MSAMTCEGHRCRGLRKLMNPRDRRPVLRRTGRDRAPANTDVGEEIGDDAGQIRNLGQVGIGRGDGRRRGTGSSTLDSRSVPKDASITATTASSPVRVMLTEPDLDLRDGSAAAQRAFRARLVRRRPARQRRSLRPGASTVQVVGAETAGDEHASDEAAEGGPACPNRRDLDVGCARALGESRSRMGFGRGGHEVTSCRRGSTLDAKWTALGRGRSQGIAKFGMGFVGRTPRGGGGTTTAGRRRPPTLRCR